MLKKVIITTIVVLVIASTAAGVFYAKEKFSLESDTSLKSISYNQVISPGEQNYKHAASVPVLLYHGIVESEDDENITILNFREHMYLLKANGYKTITLDQLSGFLENNIPVPEKSFLLTFDDNRKDSYYNADPVLADLDYSAVMFVIASWTKESDPFHLSKLEVAAMMESGRWEIGSHSYDGHKVINIDGFGNEGHFLANKMWLSDENRLETDDEYEARVYKDLYKSVEMLESEFNVEIDAFAYPYGDYGQDVTNYDEADDVVLENSKKFYKYSFYQHYGSNDYGNYPEQGTNLVKRYNVDHDVDAEDLIQLLDNQQD